MKVLSRGCIELNGLHFQVFDPLNFMAYVKIPFEMDEKDLDSALRLVRLQESKYTTQVGSTVAMADSSPALGMFGQEVPILPFQ